MDITRAILDGIAMAAIFNGAVAAFVLINPRFFFDSYPKKIQNSAPEKVLIIGTWDNKNDHKCGHSIFKIVSPIMYLMKFLLFFS